MDTLSSVFVKAKILFSDCLYFARSTKFFLKEISKLHAKLSTDYLAKLARYVPPDQENFKNVSQKHRSFCEAFLAFNNCITESAIAGHYQLKLLTTEIKNCIKKTNENKKHIKELCKISQGIKAINEQPEMSENQNLLEKIMNSVVETVDIIEKNTLSAVKNATENHMASIQKLFRADSYKKFEKNDICINPIRIPNSFTSEKSSKINSRSKSFHQPFLADFPPPISEDLSPSRSIPNESTP
ncbi:unnamed protein product [Blepharisma stoltei]|uniref:Uncharacterized protein n=1 Tax=Blepharisma stoltei TaxID=1481888 RepID=A0AAU9K3C7_9CILI|nr:unnamed protein product [Blepharisma stoltei]